MSDLAFPRLFGPKRIPSRDRSVLLINADARKTALNDGRSVGGHWMVSHVAFRSQHVSRSLSLPHNIQQLCFERFSMETGGGRRFT